MFGIGAPELILIMVVALLVFGPKRLPELARTLGKGVAEFRRTSTELRRNLNEAADMSRIEPEESGRPGRPDPAATAPDRPPAPTPEPGGSGELPGDPLPGDAGALPGPTPSPPTEEARKTDGG